MKILILAEHNNTALQSGFANTLTAAKALNGEVHVLIAGFKCDAVVEQCAQFDITKIFHVDSVVYQHQLAENLCELIVELAKDYQYILAPSTSYGKNILPRLAALLDVGVVSDVIEIVDQQTFVRPIYAGNALARVQPQDGIKLLTIRSTAFTPATSGAVTATIEKIDRAIANNKSEFVSEEIHVSERPELTAADIIIAGGRGLKSAENFRRLEKIADKLGAAIGASRAAVDAGFAPNDWQVGQTGKIVAPKLYIAIGISGAIQHLAGMKDSKIIVAINTDPDAPIFQIADYGLVADLFSTLDELEKTLS